MNSLIWNQVLISHICDDHALTKLWCTSRNMQADIIEHARTLECHIRAQPSPTVNSSVFPSFVSKLKNLQHVTIVERTILRSSIFTIIDCTIKWQELPPSVVWIEIPNPDDVLTASGYTDLIRFLNRHPNILLVPYSYHSYNYQNDQYTSMLDVILSGIKKEFKKISFFSYFTSITEYQARRLRIMYENFSEEEKAWLQLHWFPCVRCIDFTGKINDDDSEEDDYYTVSPLNAQQELESNNLEQWCYQMFPNLDRCINTLTLPQTDTVKIFKYRHFGYTGCLIRPLPVLPKLLSLNITVNVDIQPVALPFTPRSCVVAFSERSLHVNTEVRNMILQWISMLPRGLETFELEVYTAKNFWDLEMVSQLPRSLKTLTADMLPHDVELLQELPPQLRKFNYCMSGFEDQHYRALPSSLTFLDVDKTLSIDHQITLQTVSYFTSLTTLKLTIGEKNLFDEGDSRLPASLKYLTIKIQTADRKIDVIAKITFPPHLEASHIKGTGSNIIDGKLWQPLPDTIKIITIEYVVIYSFPLRWPTKLSFLILMNKFRDTSNNNKIQTRLYMDHLGKPGKCCDDFTWALPPIDAVPVPRTCIVRGDHGFIPHSSS